MSTQGRFGHDEVNILPATIGINPKGGMNTNDLKKLFKNSYLPLYPDIADKPGSRVLSKLDSGPGQKDLEFFVWCRIIGFRIHLGFPNTTSVTQETDRNYGKFKRIFRSDI